MVHCLEQRGENALIADGRGSTINLTRSTSIRDCVCVCVYFTYRISFWIKIIEKLRFHIQMNIQQNFYFWKCDCAIDVVFATFVSFCMRTLSNAKERCMKRETRSTYVMNTLIGCHFIRSSAQQRQKMTYILFFFLLSLSSHNCLFCWTPFSLSCHHARTHAHTCIMKIFVNL